MVRLLAQSDRAVARWRSAFISDNLIGLPMAGTRDHPPPNRPLCRLFSLIITKHPPFPGGWLCDWMVTGA